METISKGRSVEVMSCSPAGWGAGRTRRLAMQKIRPARWHRARHRRSLTNVLWSLHNRASEARRPDTILVDPESVHIQSAIEFDFASHFGVSLGLLAGRAAEIDRALRSWLDRHPDGIVVSLGEGLETQSRRVDNGRMLWLSVDLPDAIRLRERFLAPTHRFRHIAASALDPVWMDAVEPSRDVFIIATADVPCTRKSMSTFRRRRRSIPWISTRVRHHTALVFGFDDAGVEPNCQLPSPVDAVGDRPRRSRADPAAMAPQRRHSHVPFLLKSARCISPFRRDDKPDPVCWPQRSQSRVRRVWKFIEEPRAPRPQTGPLFSARRGTKWPAKR
jgi:hypothetical protein